MLFTDNKYTNCYYKIIDNAKSRISTNDVYTEIHHIIPKSLGGSNDKINLVKLTAREHFICHLLLTKMVSGIMKRQMSFALWSMCNRHNTAKENLYHNSRIYELARKEFIIANKILHTGRICSTETKEKISKGQIGRVGGMQDKTHSEETKLKISKSNIGKKKPSLSDDRKLQISAQFSGTTQTQEHISKRVSSRKESGYYKSEAETKIKMSHSAKNRTKLKCHCGKECSPSNYKRWHGDNCKSKFVNL